MTFISDIRVKFKAHRSVDHERKLMTLIAFYNDVNSGKFWCETSGYL